MNNQQITKQYSTIMMCLAIASMLILCITPFIPAFEINAVFFSETETGVDYLLELIGFDTLTKDTSSSNEWSDLGINLDGLTDYTLIENDIEKWIIGILVLVAFIIAIENLFKVFAFDKTQDINIKKIFRVLKIGIGWNIGYYVFCLYIILKGYEWDLEYIFSNNKPISITTKTYWSLIFQGIIIIWAILLLKHWDNAMAGKVTPLNLSFRGGLLSTFTSSPTEAEHQIKNNAQNVRNEIENLELLKKYKELLDNGIVTKDEYLAKKKELLTKFDSQATAKQPQSASTSQKRIEVGRSHTCQKCNYPLTASQQVCPHCGAKVIDKKQKKEKEKRKIPLKIYVYEYAFLNVFMAIFLFIWNNAVYPTTYNFFKLDILHGAVFISLSILSILVIKHNKGTRKACTSFCNVCMLTAVICIAFPIIASVISGSKFHFYWASSLGEIFISVAFSILIRFASEKDMIEY